MVERLLDGHPVEVQVGVRPERPAGGRDDEPPHAFGLLAPKALPDRAVLGVHWPDPARARRLHDQGAGHHQHLLRREGDVPSGRQRRERRGEGTGAGDGDQDEIASRVGHHLVDAPVELCVPGLALDHVDRLPHRGPPALREAEEAQPLGVAVDHVESLLPD